VALVLFACTAPGAVEPALSTNVPPAAGGLPLWEVGLFGMVGRLPHYRGADEYKVYVLPLPYAIYRGEFLQADREGVRGLFYKGPRIETDLSMNGSPPVDDSSRAREGMPELEPLVEMGPSVKVHLYRGARHPKLYAEAAGRAVISVDRSDLGSRYEGKRASLGVALTEGRFRPWLVGMRVGVDFADAGYNGYFYDVSESEVLPDRARYQSEGGYGGWALSGFLVRELTPALSISLYGRWDNLDGAVYEDSPLVKRENNFVIGTAVIWRIAVSRQRVRNR
jgi:outer membrane scaffolding protein for murein synthesis (MipA/OmpV family)